MGDCAGAEVVIVGGGFAGLAVAGELARRDGPRPLVVEAGPDAGHAHYRWELDRATADSRWLDPPADPHFWRPYSATGVTFTGMAGLRRRLGGRSLYWHGMALPIDPWALREPDWPAAVVRDLATEWDGGEPLLTRVQRDLAAWVGAPGGGLRPDQDPVKLAGYRFEAAPLAVRRAPDGRWKAYSPLEHWSETTRVLCDGYVTEVLLDRGRARGVRVRHAGTTRDIAADAVVLAASTIENSRLAIQALRSTGAIDEPRLDGLVDKVAQGFVATFAPDRLPPVLAGGAGTYVAPGGEGLRSNVYLNVSVNPAGLVVVDGYLIGEQRPGPHGSVRCVPAPDAPWQSIVDCRLGPDDVELVARQRAELQRVCDELYGEHHPLPFEDSPEFGSPDLADRLVTAQGFDRPGPPFTYAFPLGSELHEAGTLPLGRMLDDRHQLHAIPGLFVAGPASFPRSGAANPAVTILALGARLGATLAG
ncbi:oxidoreductase [Rugosimonospora africana]|uniref:Oxidoreductase n=2 Tax=Rugosimonospora africana TaxID=556532 RepID=A0A8J3QKP2_9ACTN|nr:oxidoreductase [Rugosimonospora africana]